FFKKDKDKGPDPLRDLTPANMEAGYFVDYDMKTWEVTAHNRYDWGEGDITHEWQIKSGDEVVYLELESDDEDYWSLNRKIAFSRLEGRIKDHIMKTGDGPDEIAFEGEKFYLEEMAAGHILKEGQSQGRPMLRWSYENEDGRRYLCIEQWGEGDFESSIGEPVQEYQFTNILPRE
ncbi:MAG: DUF4178 domain-containing protein, partial [Thermodesulfobacteriota bacterium]|nr:DUF4178 domain-containing protein [Thermodesulfobacteriota bacterium]